MRTCTQNHVPKDQGSILLVVVLVAAAVLILAGVAAPIFFRGENQRHTIETQKRLQSAFKLMFPEGQAQTKAKANMWTDFGYTPGTPSASFYDLRALVERSAVATSDATHGTVAQFTGTFPAWNGPYWQGSIDQQNRPVDAWGRPMRLRPVNGGWQVMSLGANGADNTGASITPVGDDLVYPELPYTIPVIPIPPSIYYNLANGYIGRANIDGTNPNHTFINTGTTGLSAMAVDDNYLYWIETTRQRICRADRRTGGNITSLVALNHPDCKGLAVDSNYLYWSYRVDLNGQIRAIGRYKLDGTSTDHNWITFPINGQFTPTGLAVNSSFIFWLAMDGQNIGRANLDGSNPNNGVAPTYYGTQITANDSYIYWTIAGRTEIRRADANPVQNVKTNYILPGYYAASIVASDSYLYWAYSSAGVNEIRRANLTGTGMTTLIALPSDSVGGIAVR